jgi:nicotinamidase-related amidase
MTDTALLVLDLQRDFLENTGRMPIARAQVEPLIAAANAAVDAATARGEPIVYVVNAFPRSQWIPNLFRRGAAVAGTPGAALDPRVHIAPGAATIPKEHSDAFTNPALDALLRERGIRRVVVLGVFAGACVRATVRGAIGRGYRASIVSEAIGAASDAARDRSIRRMVADGAEIVSSAG